MKNHEFTTIATQIANRCGSWVHGTLTRGPGYALKDMEIEDRRRFCDSIRTMLSWIEEDEPRPVGLDWQLSQETLDHLAEIDKHIIRS